MLTNHIGHVRMSKRNVYTMYVRLYIDMTVHSLDVIFMRTSGGSRILPYRARGRVEFVEFVNRGDFIENVDG